MSRHAAVQKPFVSPARALLTHWYSPIVTLFQPQLVSPTDLSCMQSPRLAGNNNPCFGSDTYGMLVAWKHIPWPILSPQVGKQSDIT
jgi:hypothetical protein